MARLKGPVVPVNICFRRDGTVDFQAVGRYVDWLCRQKAPVLMLTAGSSEYAWMTEDDIWRLTEEVAKANAGRSLFIAASGFWPARKAREFLRHADQVGADVVMVQMVVWGGAPPADAVRGYIDLLDGETIPLLLYWNPWVAGDTLPPRLLEEICELAGRPNIVGMKNDGHPFYDYYDLIRATQEEDFAVVSGGQMRNFIFGYPLGSPAYLCTVAPYRPDIALEFHARLVAGRVDDAWEIIRRYEEPLMAAARDVNWLVLMKTAIMLLGLYPNNLPAPPTDRAVTEQEIERASALMKELFGVGVAARA